MKRIFYILSILMLVFNMSVYAEDNIMVEELPAGTTPLLDIIDNGSIRPYVAGENSKNYGFNFRGYNYDIKKSCGTESGSVDEHFASYNWMGIMPFKISEDDITNPDCIWTGEYYYKMIPGGSRWFSAEKNAAPLYLRDTDGNEVKRLDLRTAYRQHAKRIGYYNGTYYCELIADWSVGNAKNIKTTDFENWEDTTEEVPFNFRNIVIIGKKTSLDGNTLYDVVYEDGQTHEMFYTLGDWMISRDEDSSFCFSNDNIYFRKVNYPAELKEKDEENNYGYYAQCVYEKDGKVIIEADRRKICKYSEEYSIEDMERFFKKYLEVFLEVYSEEYLDNYSLGLVRLSFDETDLFSDLDEMKEAPYIKLNNKLLGFEVPPVIEDGSTLVPMRFLFEQMGADVEWEQDTLTATVTKGEDVISFLIDNTEASVNGSSKTMDVPARLINDKTMIPIRFLSENLGYTVSWDGDSRMVTITAE